MRVVGAQIVVQYLLEEGPCADLVLLVELGQYTLDLAYWLIETF